MTRPDAGKPDLERHARALADALARGDFASAVRDFTLQMRVALSQAQLASVYQSIEAKHGARKSLLEARTDRQAGFDVVLVTCQHERARLDVKVVYDGEGRVAGLFFLPAWEPPDYAVLADVVEKEVRVGAAPWELPATLTLPKGDGPFPAVVLVHGSGPHDRDETIGPNRPFKDLALGLASRGVAVLRYEKRTKAHASRMATDTSVTLDSETVDDALSAADLLRRSPGIDAKRVFVLGHSLGGQAMPRVGARDSALAGLIILAGSTRPLHEVMVEQLEHIASLDGKLDDAEKQQIDAVREQAKRVEALRKAGRAESDAPILGVPPAYWLDLLKLDAPSAAQKLSMPILVLQGERDYQVTMKDFARWKRALAKRKNVRLVSYPELNHLFMAGVGVSGPAEYERPGHVDGRVIEEIARFVRPAGG